jgi:hypothetical protein
VNGWAFGRPVNASANTRQHTMQGANVTALCLFPHKFKNEKWFRTILFRAECAFRVALDVSKLSRGGDAALQRSNWGT